MSFEKIAGQAKVLSVLRRSLEKDRVPHAFLFAGPDGCGHAEAAEALAQAFFCSEKKGVDPCGICRTCLTVESKAHPDFYWLKPEEDSHVLKIEDIRELIARASLQPFQADRSVFVIERAECMNDVSQNALLKTLEEPGGKTHFILITAAPAGLLPTIRSRVQTLNFLPKSAVDAPVSETEPVEREVAAAALRNIEMAVTVGRLAPETAELAKMEREEAARTLDRIADALRDALVIRSGAKEILGSGEFLPQKERLASLFEAGEIIEKIELVGAAKEKVLQSMNMKLTLSTLWEALYD